MVIALRDPFILGPILLVILIIETVLLKKHYVKYVCIYIGVNIIPVIGVILNYIYISTHRVEGLATYPLISMLIFMLIVFMYLCLTIYFFIKIIIKLIRKEKLKE